MRGDLLHKLGRLEEARAEFERAASLTRNERERNLLLARAAACASSAHRVIPARRNLLRVHPSRKSGFTLMPAPGRA